MFKKYLNIEKKNNSKSKFLLIESKDDNLKYEYILNKKLFKIILSQKNDKQNNLLVLRIATLYSQLQ